MTPVIKNKRADRIPWLNIWYTDPVTPSVVMEASPRRTNPICDTEE